MTLNLSSIFCLYIQLPLLFFNFGSFAIRLMKLEKIINIFKNIDYYHGGGAYYRFSEPEGTVV